jgi:putative transposase
MGWKNLLESISEPVNDHLRLRNAYLMAENRILRHRIDGRVQLTDGDRKELAEMGAKLGKKALETIATITKPETILAWNRRFADRESSRHDNTDLCLFPSMRLSFDHNLHITVQCIEKP